MLRQYELVDLVKSYDPNADEDALNRAYVFAMKKHGAQLRTSGDPYYSHPIEVAGILTKFRLDCNSIIAGLLHDTVEDTDKTVEEIIEAHNAGRAVVCKVFFEDVWMLIPLIIAADGVALFALTVGNSGRSVMITNEEVVVEEAAK